MSTKRKWEAGGALALSAVIALGIAFGVRQWLLDDALVRAVWKVDAAEVRRLLRQGANPNHRDRQYHHAMISSALNSGATLKVLLQAGANPNTRTPDGEFGLIHAAAASYHDVVQILLRYGAEVNVVDANGQTALMAAAQAADSPAVVRTLLEAGARVSPKNPRGQSAIDITRKRLSECGMGIGKKWQAQTARRQRARRSEILRLLLQAERREASR
jgi:hypothetical protein